jgi:hypothetical protein
MYICIDIPVYILVQLFKCKVYVYTNVSTYLYVHICLYMYSYIGVLRTGLAACFGTHTCIYTCI